jgi:hypothetical protein
VHSYDLSYNKQLLLSWPIDAVLLHSFSQLINLPPAVSCKSASQQKDISSSLAKTILSTLVHLSAAFFGEVVVKATPYNCSQGVTELCEMLQQHSKDLLEQRLKSQLVWEGADCSSEDGIVLKGGLANQIGVTFGNKNISWGEEINLPLTKKECSYLKSALTQEPHLLLLLDAVIYKMDCVSETNQSKKGLSNDSNHTIATVTEKIIKDIGYVTGYAISRQTKYLKEDKDARKIYLLLRNWNNDCQAVSKVDLKTIKEIFERLLHAYHLNVWLDNTDARFILANGVLANEIILFYVHFYADRLPPHHSTAANIQKLILIVSKISIHKDLPSSFSSMLFHNCINAAAAIIAKLPKAQERFRQILEDMIKEELGRLNLDSCCICAGLKRLYLFAKDGKFFP